MAAYPPAPIRRRGFDLLCERLPLRAAPSDRLKGDQNLAVKHPPRTDGCEFLIPGTGPGITVVQERCELRVAAVHAAMPGQGRLGRPSTNIGRVLVGPIPKH